MVAWQSPHIWETDMTETFQKEQVEAIAQLDIATSDKDGPDRRIALSRFLGSIARMALLAAQHVDCAQALRTFASQTEEQVRRTDGALLLWIHELGSVVDGTDYEGFARFQRQRSSLQFLLDIYRNTNCGDWLSTIEEDIVDIDQAIGGLYESLGGERAPEGTPDHHWWWTEAALDQETTSH